ncbi:MAG: hypothetical protein KatS3mg031_2256 [Chitinophagales bacterium]|nr:MAG: hypothetical protein KatS3mg031_2256 [Chitinophagales bacterium]
MKKTLTYLAVLLVMAALVIFINQNKKQHAQVPPDQDFAVKDVSIIGRIRLTDPQGTTADLRRANGYWTINGKYRVMPSKIQLLLETVQKITISKYVSNVQMPHVMKELSEKATRVELFKEGEEKPFKVYYVGGHTADSKGTYMIMEIKGQKANRPYVMYIPGMEGIVDVRYFTNEEEWRDTRIFSHTLDDIDAVAVTYPEQPENSFRIQVMHEDSFQVFSGAGQTNHPGTLYKEGVKRYLSSFSFIHAEAFVNERAIRDSLVHTRPFAIISLTDKSGSTHEVTIYLMPLNKRSKLQYDQFGNKLPYDLDRYYAFINQGKDFVIIQDFVFGKLLRKYPDFFTKRNPT